MSLIEAKNLSARLGDRQVLSEVSLSVQAGELVGLIGPNGVGKSTCMKSLASLIPVESEAIEMEGKPKGNFSRTELAKKIAYLPQAHDIHWPLTVKRVVALGRLPFLQPWQSLEKEDNEIVARVMQQTDVLHLQDRIANELAGGEKALVLLARVLAGEPKIVLADEPVSGLDPNHQIQVMQLFQDYVAPGNGALVILHDLSLAARFCHKLYLMHEGRILSAGNPKEVLSAENLKTAYGIEVKFGTDEEFYVVPWRRL